MLDFVIIGAAQSGLSMAYFLKQSDKRFLIVDKGHEIGASWLNRWDSLRLFTPTEFNHLPGMKFPAAKGHYPSKKEVAAYFKQYANEFEFPIRLNTLITKVKKVEDCFFISSENDTIKAKGLIVATGPFHIPYIPPFYKNISSEIFQIHSNYYKNPKQLVAGPTLVVGAGDSGFQILNEISKKGRRTYFSGDEHVKVLPQKIFGKTLWWWLTISGFLSISKASFIGKKLIHHRQPIIGTDVKEILNRSNVTAVGRTLYANGCRIETQKKSLTEITNIVWATGYRPNFSWIQNIELTKDGYPVHHRGVSPIKNLYFIGLPWLYTRGSATLGGVKKDAKYLMKYIEALE